MKKYPYALATDGSNDNGLKNMNPLTVRKFDINAGKVKTSFLDMCMTPSGTALDIYLIEKTFLLKSINHER